MKFKVLDILTNAEGFVSGEYIGGRLNISRTAVSKNVSKLKEMGYNIQAVNNKGYKLKNNNDIINAYELNRLLDTENLGRNSVFLDEIDSTNDEAKRYAVKGEKEGFLVFSDSQSSGRGRLGRAWKSEKGSSLYFSFILKPDIMPYEAPLLTLVAGIGVMRGLKKITGLEVKIKWPNDIILNGKKVVGILTEMSVEMERVKYIIVGIGINTNNESFDEEIAYKATSLAKEANKKFNRAEVLSVCLKEIENCYKVFKKSGFSALRQEYKENCANIGENVKLMIKDREIIGNALDINEKGEIIIEKENGERINIFGGEVSLRRADGSYI